MTTKVAKYTTSDQLAPTITFNPVNKKTAVDPSASLTLTFSEKVYERVISANDNIFAYIDNLNVNSFVYLRTGSASGVDVPFTATIDGLVITIKPTAKLESGVRYYYGLLRNVEDINGTDVAAPTGVYFDAADYTAPKLLAVSSTNFAPLGTGVAASASMWVKFSESVVVSTGSVIIRREDGTIFQTVSGTGLTLKSDDDTVLKIAHNNFEPYTNYFVEVGASVVVDKSGNPNALFNDPTPEKGWLFTTSDTYALTATVTPSGENTPRTVSLELNFNKVPQGQSDKYVSVYKADGTAVYQFAATSAAINSKTAIFTNVALDANQAYYARVEANAFKDASGNLYAGIMDNSWTFSTVNNIAPKVVTLAPADNAASVDTQTSSLVITFDRNIALGSGMIAVRHTDGSLFDEISVANTVVNAKTLTINLTKALEANTGYYVIVPAAAVTNTEITKDPFAGIINTYTWNFTTSTDQTAPKLVTWTPNATTIADNHPTLVMTFDENVVLGAGNVKVVKASDNTTALTIPVTASMVTGKTVSVTYTYDATLKNGLDKNTDYYVLVDAGVVKDAAANAFAGVTATTTWTFKTGKDFATDTDPVIDNSLEFKVYPNPFVDYVIVDNASELTKVVITNIAGQVVKEVVTPDSRIQLNELRSGVYFISLYQGNTVAKTVKIAKR
jgi:methionine-rich copper-binding protein CopC